MTRIVPWDRHDMLLSGDIVVTKDRNDAISRLETLFMLQSELNREHTKRALPTYRITTCRITTTQSRLPRSGEQSGLVFQEAGVSFRTGSMPDRLEYRLCELFSE